MDMDYHVRHSALPKPGRYRELFNLTSRLHGTLLERTRPLWEMHVIEGLQNRQFAVYTKTHHAAVDGARSIHISKEHAFHRSQPCARGITAVIEIVGSAIKMRCARESRPRTPMKSYVTSPTY